MFGWSTVELGSRQVSNPSPATESDPPTAWKTPGSRGIVPFQESPPRALLRRFAVRAPSHGASNRVYLPDFENPALTAIPIEIPNTIHNASWSVSDPMTTPASMPNTMP